MGRSGNRVGNYMAATRTARVTLTLLMAFTVVVSIAAAPVTAVGHDPTHVGDDDDPIEVESDNDSVSVESGDDSVSVGTDGVETDTDDTTDDVTSGSTDDATDGLATTQDEEDEELPFNYSDINSTLSLVPVDLCQERSPREVPDPPAEPPVGNPTPVDPTSPPSAPLTQCDVFNPYDPPFDPTDLPDDSEAGYRVYEQEVSPEGVTLVVGGSASPDSDYPEGRTIAGVQATEDGVQIVQYTRGDDGDRDYVVFTDVQHAPGTREGSVEASTLTIGKRAGASIVCDGETCAFDQSVAPVGGQEIPTNRSGDDGGSDGPPADVPCEAPVGPGDLPESPVDPTNPPEPLPPVENPTPVDPTKPPSSPLGPCDAYDPNDPPSTNPDPDAQYNVYELDDDSVVVGGTATYNRSSGHGGRTIAGVIHGDNETTIVQYTRGEDGQKPFVTFASANVDRDSLTKVGFKGYQIEGGTVVVVSGDDRRADASFVCDGEVCTLSQGVAPVGDQEVRTATEDADQQESAGESTSPDTTTSTDSTNDGADSRTGSTNDDASSSSADTTTSATGSAGSTVAATAPADSTAAALGVPSAFKNGLPDTASAAEALMDMV